MDVRSQTAIVTGASRGIGRAVAIELGRRGVNLVLAARTVEVEGPFSGTIMETAAAVEAGGGRAVAVRTDMTDVRDIENLVRTAEDRFGGIDIVVNNAAATMAPIAIERSGGLDELAGSSNADPVGGTSLTALSREDWLRQFDTNLHGPFSLMQAAVPSMQRRGGGVFVNVTSGAADLMPVPPSAPESSTRPVGAAARVADIPDRIGYAASKAALNRLGNVLAPELRALGIAVVSIDPGYTRNETVELLGGLGIVDADAALPIEVSVRAIVRVITADDRLAYSGTVVRASDIGAAS